MRKIHLSFFRLLLLAFCAFAVAGCAIPTKSTSLIVGDGFACRLRGGVTYCWGDGSAGLTGDGVAPRGGFNAPVPVNTQVKFASITAGGLHHSPSPQQHSCGLTASGIAYCWGDNSVGQLGTPSSTTTSPLPLAVAGITFTSISAGGGHTCGVSVDGDIYCWGQDDYWQTGKGGNVYGSPAKVETPWKLAFPRTNPNFPASTPKFSSVSAGGSHTCAIDTSSFLWCWGSNGNNKLGVSGANGMSPVRVGAGAGPIAAQEFKKVFAGTESTCAIDRYGDTYCWGGGKLGGTAINVGIPTGVKVALPAATNLQSVAFGWDHTCGIATGNGTAFCWGTNLGGQIGSGSTTVPVIYSPTPVVRLSGAKAVGLGSVHSCALDTAGLAWCWGEDAADQLGANTHGPANSSAPLAVAGGLVFKELSSGPNHTCAITANGSAYCWGALKSGALGVANRETCNPTASSLCRTAPVPAVRGFPFLTLAGTSYHACGLDGAGFVSCWGMNESGQLGTKAAASSNCAFPSACSEVPIVPAPPAIFTSLALGYNHSCGLRGSGSGLCWGANQGGQVGPNSNATCQPSGPNGPTISCANGPVAISNVLGLTLPAKMLSAGGAHTCAIDASDHVFCWGQNDKGQLGTDPASPIIQVGPVALPGVALAIAAGYDHTCALVELPRSSGATRLFCWGGNASGQVNGVIPPVGAPAFIHAPVNVLPGIAGEFASVSAGWGVTCAIVRVYPGGGPVPVGYDPLGGSVVCWGASGTGAVLGRPATVPPQPAPAPIASALWFREVAVGQGSACATGIDNSVYCWGNNGVGQLGRGASAGLGSSAIPTPVTGD